MTKYGHSYERWALLEWIEEKRTCPLTNQPLAIEDVFPNFSLKQVIRGDVEAYGQEVVQDARVVKNIGLASIPGALRGAGVEGTGTQFPGNVTLTCNCIVLSGRELRERDNVAFYNILSAFILFPRPTTILGFGATAKIHLAHVGVACDFHLVSWDRDAVQRDHGTNQVTAPSGSYRLSPRVTQGFDIQGRFAIEIRSGDCALLSIPEFASSGGGCGNKLGMAGRY